MRRSRKSRPRALPPVPAPDRTQHLATLVVGDAVTKLAALAVLALAVDAPVQNAGTARPFIRLSSDAWAEIEIPKFGEPPPLAIDVYSSAGLADARREALSVAAALSQNTAWTVTPKFGA
ncbi:MAG TPA: hypothetical protein VFY91_10345 [Microbacterium sp.]|nr:hypothetical protein [Microbacterium sp.]